METCLRKVVRLKGSDGEEVEVEEAVASQLQVVKHMIDDGCADDAIFLPNVTGRTLSLVIQYCNKHHLNKDDAHDLKDWDAQFVDVDQDILFNLIMAANYLDIKSLLDLACQKVADMIRGKKPEEIRKMFNIKNDFTPEEEEELRRQNAWAFDD